jgi:hypothetical protein
VWLKVATAEAPDLPDIVVYVKEARYEESKDCWMYRVQEQDKEGLWCGKERMRAEKVLKRA